MPDNDQGFERDRAAGGEWASTAFIETPRLKHLTDKGLLAVIGLSVLVGVGLTTVWTEVLKDVVVEMFDEETPGPLIAPSSLRDRVPSGTLRGPTATVTFPPTEPTVVNIWLQACADCMTAFEAQRDVTASGAMAGIPVVNVAYGQADASWAAKYGVDENLVIDAGGLIVQPLGIGTFTTLVVDAQGDIRHRDRPDRDGFAARIKGAMEATKNDARCGHDVDVSATSSTSPPSSSTASSTR